MDILLLRDINILIESKTEEILKPSHFCLFFIYLLLFLMFILAGFLAHFGAHGHSGGLIDQVPVTRRTKYNSVNV